MYSIADGSTKGLADVAEFLRTLDTLPQHPIPEARDLLLPGREVIVARAPGRLDVMGGIADYSGSLVLQLPTREATRVALQRDPSGWIRIVSLEAEANGRAAFFEMPLSDFGAAEQPLEYAPARAYFQRDPERNWAAYVAGAFLVLMRERRAVFPEGARLLISSDVPEGKGVSSSAALEIATLMAIASAFDLDIEPRDLALLGQKVENLVVGAPCGVMDQMTAVFGQAGRLLALLCQPAELQPSVGIPQEVSIWGIDSGVRHSVAGSDYVSVRVGAFMGYRIIAEAAGLTVRVRAPGRPVEILDPKWRGYLANITPSEFEQRFRFSLPEQIRGRDFLERYGGTSDPVTRVDPERTYAVRVPTAHPVYEHHRVRLFAELLNGPPDSTRLQLLGELMYQSHASYSACGLGSARTDLLVESVRSLGPDRGLFGAKITGGGSGGTVAVLGRRDAEGAIEEVVARFTRQTGDRPIVFKGSSPGGAEFGVLSLREGESS